MLSQRPPVRCSLHSVLCVQASSLPPTFVLQRRNALVTRNQTTAGCNQVCVQGGDYSRAAVQVYIRMLMSVSNSGSPRCLRGAHAPRRAPTTTPSGPWASSMSPAALPSPPTTARPAPASSARVRGFHPQPFGFVAEAPTSPAHQVWSSYACAQHWSVAAAHRRWLLSWYLPAGQLRTSE